MKTRFYILETLKFFYGLLVGSLVFLFFCLLLDVFCYLLVGGWNAFLGDWPIFSGTVSSMLYGSWTAVAFLLLTYGIICRLVMGKDVPMVLDFLVKPEA